MGEGQDRAELLPGRLLGKRYRLLRRLRDDSDAHWAAMHVGLDAEVAVEVLNVELSSCDKARERMRKSAAAAARVRSPHLVQMLDHGIEDGWPFVVTELLEGETLACTLAREGRLGSKRTMEIVTQVARALARAHASNLVHGDVRPQNVIVTDEGGAVVVKLLGIGVSRREICDVRFASPERRAAHPVDHREDLWGLAVLAVCCLTGEPRSSCDAGGDAALAGLGTWLERAFASDVGKRFHAARDLAEALARAVAEASKPRGARVAGARPASKVAGIKPVGASKAPPPPPVVPPPARAAEEPAQVEVTAPPSLRELEIDVELAPPSLPRPPMRDELDETTVDAPFDMAVEAHVSRAVSAPPAPVAPRSIRRPSGWRMKTSSIATLAVCALALGMGAHARVSRWWSSQALAATAVQTPAPPTVHPASEPVSIETSGFVRPAVSATPTAKTRGAHAPPQRRPADDDEWIEVPLPDPE